MLSVLCLLLGCVSLASSMMTPEELDAHKKCAEAFTCLSCMTAHKLCGWCTQTEWKIDRSNRKRCDLRSELERANCSNIQYMTTTSQVRNDRDLQDDDSKGTKGPAVQIRPQLVEVNLRPGETFEYDFTFRRASHYPIYVYFLMDLSKTMQDDKQTLVSLGRDLVDNLYSISENFGVAFGSFVDKVVVPFVPYNKLMDETCGNEACAPPYDFRHQLKFTDNRIAFINAINDARISSNLDAPEGQLDALMQVLVCDDQIGWPTNSRKMILLLTDSVYHFAGDGLLAGIVRPHDGLCHLNSSGYYSSEADLDYPSIGHIAMVARERKVNIIFAVSSANAVDQAYQQLPELIPGSFVDILSNDSSNIMQLLRNSYQNVSELVELIEEHKPAGVQVEIFTICNWTRSDADEPAFEEFSSVAKCDGVKPGQRIRYRARVTVKDCSALDSKTFNLSLSPIGLADSIILAIKTQCACECEKKIYQVTNSPACFGRGTLVCGKCESCQSPYVGAQCNCDERLDNSARCRETNTSAMCTGRGYCDCGECMCSVHPRVKDRTYSGMFCECDDFACPYDDNRDLCGGSDRGQCVCGKCQCKPGFEGADCSCDMGQSNCNASNGLLCNGQGECRCNRCHCTNPGYTGRVCEDCLTCNQVCDQNKDCAQCVGFKRGPRVIPGIGGAEATCDPQCGHVVVVDSLTEHSEQPCYGELSDEAGCYFYFAVTKNDSSYSVFVKRAKDCAREANIAAIVGGVGGAILLIGLLLIAIWKIYVTINDRREYARFLKANETARPHVVTNPLYEKPEVTVANPMYTGQFKL